MGVAMAVERATEAQPAKAKAARGNEVYRWLAHPFLIAVCVALLVNFLIPNFTRKWQNHQKALEIKTGLVSDMGQSVSNAVMTGRFIAGGLVSRSSSDPRADQRAFNDGFRAWTTSEASIGAKLQAYFGSTIGTQWRSFGNAVTDYFQLSATPARGRSEQVDEILAYSGLPLWAHMTKEQRRALIKSSTSTAFQDAYAQLGRGLLSRSDELVQNVLDSGVSGL
jgi:hypothetical protein